ncbi:phage tail protein [Paraburkholderia monticola]|uniref:Phage tail protein n=2 Tax=Paraburkholderia monticola TaxID=1399968 RepID=A0A149PCN4_9BURK|nr:phage tail protein [Paraburkholderia monticola]
MNIATASASATLTADEIIVGSALGGLKYTLASFSKTINLATTGAGGMDTGSAPASGFVAIYAIYNPTTQTAALLATNAATKQGNVYGGANPPAGYTASALVSVWQTNSSGQLTVGTQEDRSISTVSVGVLTSSTTQSTPVALTISSAVPANARSVSGYLSLGSTSISSMFLNLFSSSASTGQQTAAGTVSAGTSLFTTFRNLQMVSAQTLFYTAGNGAGTPTFSITVSGYDF